jgi:hypothetical protein
MPVNPQRDACRTMRTARYSAAQVRHLFKQDYEF